MYSSTLCFFPLSPPFSDSPAILQCYLYHRKGLSTPIIVVDNCLQEGMATCEWPGNSDMYGLGIRVGFYIQWYGIIIAPWIADGEVLGLRFSNAMFIAATFLALIIQTSSNALSAVDIYIVLLLTFGAFFWFLPLYLWRLVIGCNPLLDPTRWPLVPSGPLYSALYFTLLVAVACYQLWFWANGLNSSVPPPANCTEYGFLFSMVPLHQSGFVAFNIICSLTLLLIAFAMLVFQTRAIPIPKCIRKKEKFAMRHLPGYESIHSFEQCKHNHRM